MFTRRGSSLLFSTLFVQVMAFSATGCGAYRINLGGVGYGIPYHGTQSVPKILEGSVEMGGPKSQSHLAWSAGAYYRLSHDYVSDKKALQFGGAGLVGRFNLFRLFANPGTVGVPTNCSKSYIAGHVSESCTYAPVAVPKVVYLTGGLIADLSFGEARVGSRHDFGLTGPDFHFRIDEQRFGVAFGTKAFIRVQYPYVGYLESQLGYEYVAGFSLFVGRVMFGLAWDYLLRD